MLLYIVIVLLAADLAFFVIASGFYVAAHYKHSNYKSIDDLICEKGLIYCWGGFFRGVANAVRGIFKKEKLDPEKYITQRGSVLLSRIQWMQAVAVLVAIVLMFCLQLILEG